MNTIKDILIAIFGIIFEKVYELLFSAGSMFLSGFLMTLRCILLLIIYGLLSIGGFYGFMISMAIALHGSIPAAIIGIILMIILMSIYYGLLSMSTQLCLGISFKELMEKVNIKDNR